MSALLGPATSTCARSSAFPETTEIASAATRSPSAASDTERVVAPVRGARRPARARPRARRPQPSTGRSAWSRADERPSEVLTHEVLRGAKGRQVRPKTAGQKRYVDAIRDNVITFGIGPAGTGKSWLAVAMAVQALQAKQVQRIILTRPAVEAGERLGFLPGRPDGQDRPVPAAAVRRAVRHGRPRGRPDAARAPAPSRSRRWRSCAAARSTTASSSSTRRRTPRPSR